MPHFLDQLGKRSVDQPGAADKHHIHSAREFFPLPPIGLAQPAPRSIPLRRLSDPAADGEPHTLTTVPRTPERDEPGALLALPVLKELLDVLATPEP